MSLSPKVKLAPSGSSAQMIAELVKQENIDKSKHLKPINVHSLAEVVSAMADPKTGVKVEERRYSSMRTFTGTDAVDWMFHNTTVEYRHQAVELGQELLKKGYIYHVYSNQLFRDNDNRYCFQDIILRDDQIQSIMTILKNGVQLATRRYNLQTYHSCFVGSDAVECLLVNGICANNKEAVSILQFLLNKDEIRHVCRSQPFRDGNFFYTFKGQCAAIQGLTEEQLERLITAMKAGIHVEDRKRFFRLYRESFIGSEALDWMMKNVPGIENRNQAIELGTELLAKGLICDQDGEEVFRDGNYFYSFQSRVRKSGYLIKKGNETKMNLRWFVLQDNILWYYESQRQSKTPLGNIPLQEAYILPIIESSNDGQDEYGFKVVLPSRIYVMLGKSFEETREWVDKLSLAAVHVSTENQKLAAAEELITTQTAAKAPIKERQYLNLLREQALTVKKDQSSNDMMTSLSSPTRQISAFMLDASTLKLDIDLDKDFLRNAKYLASPTQLLNSHLFSIHPLQQRSV